MVVKHTAHGSKGVFTAMKDGKKAGEMTYSMAGTDKMIVDHTEVDEAFKGMGADLSDSKVLKESFTSFSLVISPFFKASRVSLIV